MADKPTPFPGCDPTSRVLQDFWEDIILVCFGHEPEATGHSSSTRLTVGGHSFLLSLQRLSVVIANDAAPGTSGSGSGVPNEMARIQQGLEKLMEWMRSPDQHLQLDQEHVASFLNSRPFEDLAGCIEAGMLLSRRLDQQKDAIRTLLRAMDEARSGGLEGELMDEVALLRAEYGRPDPAG